VDSQTLHTAALALGLQSELQGHLLQEVKKPYEYPIDLLPPAG